MTEREETLLVCADALEELGMSAVSKLLRSLTQPVPEEILQQLKQENPRPDVGNVDFQPVYNSAGYRFCFLIVSDEFQERNAIESGFIEPQRVGNSSVVLAMTRMLSFGNIAAHPNIREAIPLFRRR